MLGLAWFRFNAIQQQGARKNEYTCLWCFLPSCWNTSRFTVTVKSTITHSNFRHCRVSFSPFLRQPFPKQLYFIKQAESMSMCFCSAKDHRRCQNVVRTSVTHLSIGLHATFLFLSHYDVIFDLLLISNIKSVCLIWQQKFEAIHTV